MGPRKKPNEQVRLNIISQIWRPSKNPADAGSQIRFSRICLKINMQPKLCKPSHEAHQTSSFKTYLPNLTAFRNSSRRWTTDLIFKDLPRNEYAAQTTWALVRSPTNKFVENVSSKSDGDVIPRCHCTMRFESSSTEHEQIKWHRWGKSLSHTEETCFV